tara:strand:- start:72 stop:485 length:414 start_codon:yes stop_codon:yes gene_type:complete
MANLLLIFMFSSNILMANDYISKRQDSMQEFNKLMRSANQMIKNNEVNDDLSKVYDKIENIMTEYPSLFPDDSFGGKTKASEDIIYNRDKFNEILHETKEFAKLASIASKNKDIKMLQQSHKNLYGSCKSCHSRFKN